MGLVRVERAAVEAGITRQMMLLLFPFGLSADQIVWWGFIATVVAALCAVWGGIAATAAAKYGKDAPTKEDLKRVEGHVYHLEEVKSSITRMDTRLDRQEEREAVQARARQISLSITGRADVGDQMAVRLIMRDTAVTPTRVELFNENGTRFAGSFDCRKLETLLFEVELDADSVRQWYNGGRPTEAFNRRLLTFRVYTILYEQEVYREAPVELTQGTRHTSGYPTYSIEVFTLKGNV